jgi:hypothetical protein
MHARVSDRPQTTLARKHGEKRLASPPHAPLPPARRSVRRSAHLCCWPKLGVVATARGCSIASSPPGPFRGGCACLQSRAMASWVWKPSGMAISTRGACERRGASIEADSLLGESEDGDSSASREAECRGRKGQLRADAARNDGDRVEVDLAPPAFADSSSG